ncbi:NAD(P)H-dependent flavin oxidoreductase [Thalassobacillus devorans]|uniref:NAD(P)H-dependent flavin oxidoreductase n=1 Tax=Thalassobacillus devorans TaxID=279813 RepID=UPI0004905CD3|nr:nitronate monooxygenase [Thalassobacillus devorans]
MKHVCDALNIRYPIIQGGMGNISNAPLAAAVSEAGGLGTIGAGTMAPEELEPIIIETKERTVRPFAVNVAIKVTPYLQDIMELIIKHDVPVVSLSAGNPAPLIPGLKEHGKKIITVTASVKQAVKAGQAGADVIVAEGYEAAGINSNLELTTLTLIPQIVDSVDLPVLAAGGIGDGRGLAAVLALGANGVQMGTRLIATQEAPFHESYKRTLLEAHENDTVIVGRSVGRVRRVMNTPYSQKLLDYEKEGVPLKQFNEMTSEDYHKIGALEGRLDEGFINGGQISGLVSDIPTVAELIESMMDIAYARVDQLHKNFRSTDVK